MDKYGNETLSALFNQKELYSINQLRHLSMFVQKAERMAGNPSGTAQNVAAIGMGALMIRHPIRGTLYALTSKMAARLYLSPIGRKWLTEGLRTPAGVTNALNVHGKLLEAAGALGGQAIGSQVVGQEAP